MDEAAVTAREGRIRLLLALEIARVARQTRDRLDFMVTIWGRYRSREPFLDTLFHRFRTASVGDLVALEEPSLLAVHAFFDEVESLRLYLTFTEDMPTTLRDLLEKRVVRLEDRAEAALRALGVEPPAFDEGGVPLDVPEGG